MLWEFLYHPQNQYLEAKVSGELTDEGLTKMASERWALLQKLGWRKILFNFIDAVNSLRIFEIYGRPAKTAGIGIPRVNHTAAWVPAGEWDKYAFMETVYRNRGYDLRIFASREEAIRYLTSE
ncbi:MAG: hypothetical protein JF616_11900 [Fibrobacteres bacterium]|jgi:hypothetical protein|nr:hypothetical protein [Fibrobacterota bacterium]